MRGSGVGRVPHVLWGESRGALGAAGMLRREARQRREYLHRRAQEDRIRASESKKQRLKQALEENRLLPTELRREALALQKSIELMTREQKVSLGAGEGVKGAWCLPLQARNPLLS
ncbi:unnamed protein product [Natator depressus]